MVADTLLHAAPPLPRRGRVPAWAWAGFVGVVGAATPVYYFLPIETQSLVNNVIAVASAVVMFAGIVWNRPTPRFAWVLLASGVLLFAAGDIAYGTSQPVPSPADMLYVSAYPLLGLGLLALARARLRVRTTPLLSTPSSSRRASPSWRSCSSRCPRDRSATWERSPA